MDCYLVHDTIYQVVICRQHHYAINPTGIFRHFRDEHKGISVEIRKQLVEYVKGLNLLEPNQVNVPQDRIQIDALSTYDGYICLYERCREARGTIGSIQKHCQDDHQWNLSAGIMWREQKVQTFFQGAFRKYILL